jgi:brefeldin A-inhibited guanine nucleotide-exchange protein
MGGAPNASSNNLASAAAGGDGEPGSTNTSKPGTPLAGASAANDVAGAGAAGSAAAGDALSKKRAYKEKWQEGIALFNSKPKKGIALLQVRYAGLDITGQLTGLLGCCACLLLDCGQ